MKVPSTFDMDEMKSFAKLFETWHIEAHKATKQQKINTYKRFVKIYLGWIVSILQVVVQIKKEFF